MFWDFRFLCKGLGSFWNSHLTIHWKDMNTFELWFLEKLSAKKLDEKPFEGKTVQVPNENYSTYCWGIKKRHLFWWMDALKEKIFLVMLFPNWLEFLVSALVVHHLCVWEIRKRQLRCQNLLLRCRGPFVLSQNEKKINRKWKKYYFIKFKPLKLATTQKGEFR